MNSPVKTEEVITAIVSDSAPAPVGAYSQGVEVASTVNLLFTSGQLPIGGASGDLDISSGSGEQCAIALENALAIVSAAGGDVNNVIRVTIYLSDMTEYDAVNRTYEEVLGAHRPARSVVGVSALPRGAKVEVEMVAAIP